MSGADFDLQLPSGRLRARRHGTRTAPLVLCIPGLSANLTSFDFLGQRLGGDRRQLVALDLRGRGQSDITPHGTYGWPRHAADVVAVADLLGAPTFAVIGHSMGAAVASALVRLYPGRVERLVMLDHCGVPEPSSLGPIGAALLRLNQVYDSPEVYLDAVRRPGTIHPWSDEWDRYFRYELRETEDGRVTPRTDPSAVLEDAAFGAGAYAFEDDATIYRLWRHMTMPVLLLRAAEEMVPGTGYIVSVRDARRFAEEVPSATVREIAASHYTVATSEESATAIEQFLEGTHG